MTKKNIIKGIVYPKLEHEKTGNDEEKAGGPADFETAIKATGFGKFNLLLILMSVPAGFASVFETTTMSYVFPAAQCDLDLSLQDKGTLNAITYLGMISSAVIWGFLCDTLGRRKLLCLGYFLDTIFVIMSFFSQSKIMLMVSKYLGGFIINGPFSAMTSYVSEFHAAQYRARMQMVQGFIFNFATVILPLLAMAIMPQNFYLELFNKTLEFHSWNIYLLISGIPSFASAIIFFFMPESPKFLMTTGNNDEALTIFRKVYSINSGKPLETYPITELVDEIKSKENESHQHGGVVTANRSKIQALKEGWQQVTPLFFPPHRLHLLLVCTLSTLIMMSLNTFRLWFPQIFQAINDYQHNHNETSASLCEMLDTITPSNATTCSVNLNNTSVYVNTIILACIVMSSYIFLSLFINALGKKRLLICLGISSGLCAYAIYFSMNTAYTLAFTSLFQTSASIATNVLLAVVVDLFPTTLRTMTISMVLMMGRIGAMTGNLLFPLLLQTGCAPPFFTLGSTILGCAFIMLLLPNTDLKALQ